MKLLNHIDELFYPLHAKLNLFIVILYLMIRLKFYFIFLFIIE